MHIKDVGPTAACLILWVERGEGEREGGGHDAAGWATAREVGRYWLASALRVETLGVRAASSLTLAVVPPPLSSEVVEGSSSEEGFGKCG